MISPSFALENLTPFGAGVVTATLGGRIKSASGWIWLAILVGAWFLPAPFRLGFLAGAGAGFLIFSPSLWPFVLAGLAAVSIFFLRLERGIAFEVLPLLACVVGGASIALLSLRASEKSTLLWSLAGVLGGAMAANWGARGLGVACFALGLVLLWGVARFLDWKEPEEFAAPESGVMLGCGLACFALFGARLGRDAPPFDGFLALWAGVIGVLLASGSVGFGRVGNVLAALLGPLALGAVWGTRVETGLFLGAILGGAFGSRQASATAGLVLVSVLGLWPLALEMATMPRLERLLIFAGTALFCALCQAFFGKAEEK